MQKYVISFSLCPFKYEYTFACMEDCTTFNVEHNYFYNTCYVHLLCILNLLRTLMKFGLIAINGSELTNNFRLISTNSSSSFTT
jgi:hypothetical protein